MIVDASVAFKWLVREEATDAALDLLDRGDLMAPHLILSEIGNALWKKARREQFDPAVSLAEDLARLPDYVILVADTPFMGRALEMAYQLAHPIYDCVYLAAAEYFDVRLVTADQRFLHKLEATSLGAAGLPRKPAARRLAGNAQPLGRR